MTKNEAFAKEKQEMFMLYVHKVIKIAKGVIMLWMVFTGVMGVLIMACFIREETIQAQGFAYAIPAMNKEWEIADAVLWSNEEMIRENCRAIRQQWRIQDVVIPWRLYRNLRRAFVAFANASEMKLDSDIQFYKYMIQKKVREDYEKGKVKVVHR